MTVEAHIEDYLTRRVKELGGEVRKVAWPGRRGAPDRLVLLGGQSAFVELKRPGKEPTDAQRRELRRLRAAGLIARWANCKVQIDMLLQELTA